MRRVIEDEDLLLAVLNSTSRVAGQRSEQLVGAGGAAVVAPFVGDASEVDLARLRAVRDALQGMVLGEEDAPKRLQRALEGVTRTPRVSTNSIDWVLEAPPGADLAARAALAWARVGRELPSRLRPCASDECSRFLLDRSRPGNARWCSMATCGNRAKARGYARRKRAEIETTR